MVDAEPLREAEVAPQVAADGHGGEAEKAKPPRPAPRDQRAANIAERGRVDERVDQSNPPLSPIGVPPSR